MVVWHDLSDGKIQAQHNKIRKHNMYDNKIKYFKIWQCEEENIEILFIFSNIFRANLHYNFIVLYTRVLLEKIKEVYIMRRNSSRVQICRGSNKNMI